MVRYTKNSGDRPYKRRYPGFRNLKHMSAVLASLNAEQFGQLKKYANHFLGKNKIAGLPTHHKKKIKPSSYKHIVKTEFPKSLNLHLISEETNHNDHSSESHLGGGLKQAVSALFSTGWDQLKSTGPGEALGWLYDKVVSPNNGDELSRSDQENADVLIEAYQDMDQRAEKIHGWIHIPKYDSSYGTVYYNPKTQSVHIGIRGSLSAHDWLHHNTQILTSNKAGSETSDQVRDYLVEISKDFPNHDLTVVSHSLSGTLVKDAILDASTDENEFLGNIDHLLMINPGSSVLADDTSIKQMMEDKRLRLLLNKSDIISQGWNQNLTEESNFVYGNPTANPLTAHQYRQFTSGDSEYDKNVEWGAAPFQAGAENKWEVGTATAAAFLERSEIQSAETTHAFETTQKNEN